MPNRNLLMAAVGIIFLAAACSAPTPQVIEVTRIVEQTVVVTQIVEIEKVVTATPVPPTPAPAILVTPSALAPANAGFDAWCTPKDIATASTSTQLDKMPDGARPMTLNENGEPELIIQVQSCTFVYALNSPVTAGTKLIFKDSQENAFLEAALASPAGAPNTGVAQVTAPVITDPQAWYVTYQLDVVSPEGAILRSDDVTFKRGWKPQPCYGGVWPDAVTGRCPELGEAHPWDPWFGYSPYGGVGEGVSTPGPIMKHPGEQ